MGRTLLKMWKYVLILIIANLLSVSSSCSKIENLLLDSSEDTGTTNVPYGSDRIIKCEIHSTVPIRIHWYYTDEKTGMMNQIVPSEKYSIANNGTVLRIMKMDFDTVGHYICIASLSKNVGIVLTPPKITGTNETRVIRGTKAVIKCKIIKGSPKPKIAWEYKDKFGKDFRPVPGSGDELRILSVTEQKEGSYKCVATNVAGKDEHITNLVVDFPPTISQSQEMYENFEGKSLTIPCKAVGNPKAVIVWKMNGTVITSNKKYSIEDGSLVIKNLNDKNSTSYTCEAKNYVGSAKAAFIVRVHTTPRISGLAEVKVIKGSNAVIECNIIKGIPAPDITWFYWDKVEYKNLKSSFGSQKLLLPNVEEKNAGSYKCVAENDAGKDEHVTTLIVESPPTITSKKLSVYEGIEGNQALRIPCEVIGNPLPVISWKINDKLITLSEKYSIENGVLIIKNLNENDSASYTCEAKNYIGSANEAFMVKTHTAPRITGKAEVRATRDYNAVIECDVVRGSPVPQIYWKYIDERGSKLLTLSGSGKRLILENVGDKHAGRYKCIAVNVAGTDEHITTLIIESPPTIVSKSSIVYEGLEGDIAFRIPCDVIGNPRPLITWTLNGRIINPNTKYTIDDGALVIKNPVEQDSTFYTCEAKNYIGSTTKTFEARVDKFVNRSERSKYIYILWGKTTKLDCEGYNSSSQSVRWFIESEEVPTHKPYIEIVKPTFSNDGNYTCRISDAQGYTHTHTYVVDIGFPPKIPDNFQVEDWRGDVGDILSHCEGDAKPEAQVEWEFNGKVLTNEDLKKLGDQFKWGHYRCSISNVHGSVTRYFDVKSSACFVSRKLEEIKNMPLMLTEELTWPRWDYTKYDSIVEQGDSITFFCPYDSKGTLNTFRNFPQLTELKASCHKQDTFLVNNKFYKLTDLLCNNNMQASVIREHKTCLTDTSELMRVGYRISEFVETYEVCFDHAKNMPLYARTLLTKTEGSLSGVHDWFTYPEIGNPRFQGGFTCQACCYNKTHLVNPRDFNFNAAKKTTFLNYLNEFPYWRACENSPTQTTWEDIEGMVREQLFNYDNIVAWSGTHTYQQKYGLLIPRYLWKVLKLDDDIVAIIHVNDPTPVDTDIKCKDISQTNDILYWFSASNKYTYCCELNDFVEAFGLHSIDFIE